MSEVDFVKYCPLCGAENSCREAFCTQCGDGDLSIVPEESRKVTGEAEDSEETGSLPVSPSSVLIDEGQHTFRVGEDSPATWQVSLAEELGEERPTTWGHLPRGALLCGEYRVQRTVHPHETQRAGLYLCQGPEGWVMVKAYATAYPPQQELWQHLRLLLHPNILQIYRTIEADGFYYEVQEFCTGGTLQQRVPKKDSGISPVSVDWLTRAFIPQMAAALHYLHNEGLIHRDIKPANIYVKETEGRETLVLADFDIAAVLEQTRTSRDTQRAAGTWNIPPRKRFRAFSIIPPTRAGDASRAAAIITRWASPSSSCCSAPPVSISSQLPDLFDFYLQGGRVEIPSSIPGRVSLLLRGLLIRNRRLRWGAAEVARWLAERTTDADMQRIQDDENFEMARASRPYKLNSYFCIDLPSLAEAMWHERETATEDLLCADILLNWIGTLDATVARNIRREREFSATEPALLLHSAIMFCDPSRAFLFPDDSAVTTPEAWIERALQLVREEGGPPEELCTPELLMQFEAWLRCKEHPETALGEAVTAIRRTPPSSQLEELAYLLQPDRPYQIMPGLNVRTPKEMVAQSYGPPEGWRGKTRPPCYEASCARWQSGALNAWLRQRGLAVVAEQCAQIREQLAEEPLAAFETILHLLDPQLPPVTVLFDMSNVANCRVPFRRRRSYVLRWRTIGPGVPFGALLLAEKPTGLHARKPYPERAHRRGERGDRCAARHQGIADLSNLARAGERRCAVDQ